MAHTIISVAGENASVVRLKICLVVELIASGLASISVVCTDCQCAVSEWASGTVTSARVPRPNVCVQSAQSAVPVQPPDQPDRVSV